MECPQKTTGTYAQYVRVYWIDGEMGIHIRKVSALRHRHQH